MQFSELKKDMWVQYRNGFRGSVIAVREAGFTIVWDLAGQVDYGDYEALHFQPVPLKAESRRERPTRKFDDEEYYQWFLETHGFPPDWRELEDDF